MSSIDKKIGQRFIFGVNSENIDCIINLIKKAYIGGVILYKKNYGSYQDMLSIINKLKEANKENDIPLFIAIDQEGGIVNRLPNEFHDLRNITDVSKLDCDLVTDYAHVIGKSLNLLGINMDFAPVLDIYNNSKSKALCKRCFYGNEKEIGKMGKQYIGELARNKVIAVGKHFPGHGVSSLDSHFFVPYASNYREVLDKHMVPFNEVMDVADAIMVGHIAVAKMTNLLPASMSNTFLSKYLRNKFDGLIITDEINMLKRNPIYRVFYLNKILRSLNDVILIKISSENEGYKIVNKYKKILSKSEFEVQKLNNAFDRVLEIKKKYQVNDDMVLDNIDIDKINIEIDSINSKVK